MPICSYVVIPEHGRGADVAASLSRLPGCEVTLARGGEVMLLVTDTPGAREEADLESALTDTEGIQARVFTFGDLATAPGTAEPVDVTGHAHEGARGRRRPDGTAA